MDRSHHQTTTSRLLDRARPLALAASTLLASPVPMSALASVTALLGVSEASAATVYWELPNLLTSFFPDAERVGYARIRLSDADVEELSRRVGTAPRKRDWTVFVATRGGQPVGYAVVDEVRGMHEPITYAVKFGLDGRIERVEVMVYREAYGSEVRGAVFTNQFKGKDWRSPLRIDRDLRAVSGATISSRAVGGGARTIAAVISRLTETRGAALTGS